MCTKKPSHADTNSLSSTWAPVILRFLLLYTGDLPLAESLTIETIGEHLCESGAVITDKTAITLLRRAFDKSIRIDALWFIPMTQ